MSSKMKKNGKHQQVVVVWNGRNAIVNDTMRINEPINTVSNLNLRPEHLSFEIIH